MRREGHWKLGGAEIGTSLGNGGQQAAAGIKRAWVSPMIPSADYFMLC